MVLNGFSCSDVLLEDSRPFIAARFCRFAFSSCNFNIFLYLKCYNEHHSHQTATVLRTQIPLELMNRNLCAIKNVLSYSVIAVTSLLLLSCVILP